MIPSRQRCPWGRVLSMSLFLAGSRPWVAPGGVPGLLVLPFSLVTSLRLQLPAASLTLGLVRRLAFPVGSLPWLLLLLVAPSLGLLLLESLALFFFVPFRLGELPGKVFNDWEPLIPSRGTAFWFPAIAALLCGLAPFSPG